MCDISESCKTKSPWPLQESIFFYTESFLPFLLAFSNLCTVPFSHSDHSKSSSKVSTVESKKPLLWVKLKTTKHRFRTLLSIMTTWSAMIKSQMQEKISFLPSLESWLVVTPYKWNSTRKKTIATKKQNNRWASINESENRRATYQQMRSLHTCDSMGNEKIT